MWEIFTPILTWLRDLLDNRLTTARANAIDNLDAAVSTRAAAATALSTAVWTATRAAKLDNILPAIKSVQNCAVSMTGTTYGTATITAVNTSKSIILVRGRSAPTILSSQDITDEACFYTSFADSTTVRVDRTRTAGYQAFYLTVVEFN